MYALQQSLAGIRELGARLVAVSPQTPEKNAEVRTKQRLEFPVLGDPSNAYARELGLVFAFSDELRAVYEGFGLRLPEFNGDDSWELPIPTRIVVGGDGRIRQIDADPDYTHRPEPETALDTLRAM